MRSLRRFFTRLFNSAARRAQEERLREEIAEHIALQTGENLRAGLSPIEARRQAMLKFGGVEAMKQDYRAEGGLLFIENLLADLRNAGRTIRRMPGLATVIVVSLAIGIGVNTTIFSWIQMILFQPLPAVSRASNFLLVELRTQTGGYPGASWLEYRALQTQVPALRDIVASQMVPFNVGVRGQTERTFGQLVSGNYFSALGLKPAIGRFIRPEEAERPGTEPVIVISYDYWQTRFSGAPAAVGQKVHVNERDLTVIGVAPREFQGTMLPLKFDLWAPATMAPALLGGARGLEDRSARGFSLIGIIRPGATRAEAQAELSTAMVQQAHDYPEASAGISGEILSFWDAPRGPQRMLISGLAVLQGVMLVLLLAVCGNTANLMLARGSTRQREMAVRVALGAGRWRIVSLVLSENMLLALLGAVLGAAIAVWGTTALRMAPMIGRFPILFQTRVDELTLAFAMLLGAACGLLFSAAPAIHLARLDPQDGLRSSFNTPLRSRARKVLMGMEVGLAMVVLIAAALFLQSFRSARQTDPRFRPEGVLLAVYDLSGRNPDEASEREFAARLLERLRSLPDVEAAAIATNVPLDLHGIPARPFTVQGRVRTEPGPDRAISNTVTPGYFKVMGIPLLEGNDFAEMGDKAAPAQAIVNEEFVRHYLNGADAIGRRIQTRAGSFAIIGVARNSVYNAFGEPAQPAVYFSYRDRPEDQGEIQLRTRSGNETALASEARAVLRDLDPMLPLYDVRTFSQHIERNLYLRRIPARMFIVLGPLLLGLAAIGIYAVVSYAVARRTREIGVRLAFGATSGRVVLQIIRENLGVITWGTAIGWALTLVISLRVITKGAINLPVFIGVPAILLGVATLACWIPARRASRIDPMAALRHE
ncbi:MAG TPA: ABC transporter permease [Candidatus Polarisedimenticolia bacterium]|nr:ABC transporter permease [Candidatus Polarisedimenticolia bacterium]